METQRFESSNKAQKTLKIFEKYELAYIVDKTKSNLRLLGKRFVQRNKGFGHFIYKNRKRREFSRLLVL